MTIEYQFAGVFSPEKEGFSGTIHLTNRSQDNLSEIEFHCSFVRPLDNAEIIGGKLLSREGDYHIFKVDADLAKDNSIELKFISKISKMVKVTDWPYGMFIKTSTGIVQLVDKTIAPTMPSKEVPQIAAPEIAIVPAPQSIARLNGELELPAVMNVSGIDSRLLAVVQSLFGKHNIKQSLKAVEQNGFIKLVSLESDKADAYNLTINADGIEIAAKDYNGHLYGLISLLQHIANHSVAVPCVKIEDWAEYEYRGTHLDVCRHFFDAQTIKKYIELSAFYKFNYFHWHLTDDEGWRVQINAYPELTQKGAWRGVGEVLPPQMGTGSQRYGGFYTQAEIKEVVAFASNLGVTIIPEIDLPGHCRAVLKSLPDLLIDQSDRSKYISVQSYSDNVLSPALDATYDFIYTVLDEVCELFPGEWLHVGSDEVPEGAWLDSDLCKDKIIDLGLSGKPQLHGHMLRQIEKYLQSKGKKMAGWEEVRTGELVSTCTRVYSWQGVEAGRLAAQAGHSVVMTPAQYNYLDLSHSMDVADPGYYWAGTVNLATAYGYNPRDEKLDEQYHSNIVGVQSCLWTEIVTNEDRIGLMTLPRLLAIAEVSWTSHSKKDYDRFFACAVNHIQYLENMDWNYRSLDWGW